MNSPERTSRLAAELESLRRLKQASSIFDFTASDEALDSYLLTFHGKGLARRSPLHGDVAIIDTHQVELRLPYSYPQQPPDIRWRTPILHPNVSYSGFITLRDLGLPWEPELGLDAICERLWDAARLAYLNLEQAANGSAKSWFEKQDQFELPVDPRPLRDQQTFTSSNIVRYEHRGARRVAAAEPTESEILYIGEDTPAPPLPCPARRADIRRFPPPDGDVLYIED